MSDEGVLVTGGTGCIGSWIARNLVPEDVPVVVLTAGQRFQRLKLVLTGAEQLAVTADRVTGGQDSRYSSGRTILACPIETPRRARVPGSRS